MKKTHSGGNIFCGAFGTINIKNIMKIRQFIRKKSSILFISIAAVVAVSVIVVFLALGAYKSSAAPAPKPADTDAAEYIKEMEALPVSDIEDEIYEEDAKALTAAMLENPEEIFNMFVYTNTIVVGESRMLGFNSNGFLDENHSVCGVGWSILELPAQYETIAALAPKNIVLEFGINEIPPFPGINVQFSTPEMFLTELSAMMGQIKEFLPDVNFYINSIADCTAAFYEECPGYVVVPQWNEAIEKFCAEYDIGFIDIRDLCRDHQELYLDDGLHFYGDFYPLWGAEIMKGIAEREQ